MSAKGYYQDMSGQSTYFPCSDGYFSAGGASECTLVEAGNKGNSNPFFSCHVVGRMKLNVTGRNVLDYE